MFLPASHELSQFNSHKPPQTQQRMRGLARRRFGATGLALDTTNYYPTALGPRAWHPNFPARRSVISGNGQFDWPGNIEADSLSSSRFANRDRSHKGVAGRSECNQDVPFADAAARLDEALFYACKATESFLPEFEEDIRHIAIYADDATVSLLWKAKLEHDGADKNVHTRPKSRQTKPPGLKVALEQYEEAAMEIRTCQPPQWGTKGGRDQMSPEQVRSIMKKLNVSFETIRELTDAVFEKREKIDILHKELVATHRLLCEMHEFWCTKSKAKEKRFAGMQATFEDDPFDDQRS